MSLDVADKPGVLATVAHGFAAHEVSISTVRQNGRGDAATLVIVTHSAPDAALSATIAALRDMPAVRGSPASCGWRGCHERSRRAGRD